MADPLSIATAVTTFLKTAVTIGLQIKAYKDGLDAVGMRVETICHQIDCVGSILRSLQATFDASLQDYISTATGHIGSHCRDLEKSLKDGERTLQKLLNLAVDIHGRKKERGRIGKDFKLRELSDQLDALRERLSNNLGVLQISFAAIQSWRQEMWYQSVHSQTTKIDESAALLRDAVSKYQKEGRDLLVELNEKLEKLPAQAPEVPELKNLKACLHSGWKVVAEVSTVTPDVVDEVLPANEEQDLDALFGEVDDGGIKDWIYSVRPQQHEITEDEHLDDEGDDDDDDKLTVVPPDMGEHRLFEPFDADIARSNAIALFAQSKDGFRSAMDPFDKEHEEQLVECEGLMARVEAEGGVDQDQRVIDAELMLDINKTLFQLYTDYRMWKKAAAVMEKKAAIEAAQPRRWNFKSAPNGDLEALWAAHFRAQNWDKAAVAVKELRLRKVDRVKRLTDEVQEYNRFMENDSHILVDAGDIPLGIRQAAAHILGGDLARAKAVLQDVGRAYARTLSIDSFRGDLVPVWLVGLQYYAMCAHLSLVTGDKAQHRADRARYRQTRNKRPYFSVQGKFELIHQEWDPVLPLSRMSGGLIPRINILVLGKASSHHLDRSEYMPILSEILFGELPRRKAPERPGIFISEHIIHHADYLANEDQRDIIDVALYYVARSSDPLASKEVKNVDFHFGIVLIKDDDHQWALEIKAKLRDTWKAGMEKLQSMPLICINVIDDKKASTVPLGMLPQMVTRRPHPTRARYLAMQLGALQLFTGTKADLSQNTKIMELVINTIYGRVPKKQSRLLSKRAAPWIDLLDWTIYITPFLVSILAGARYGQSLFLPSLLIFLTTRFCLWVLLEALTRSVALIVLGVGVFMAFLLRNSAVQTLLEPPKRPLT